MIVEDEAVPAMLLGQRMKEWGWEVVGIEATGRGAIALAASTEPDVILMDIRLNDEIDGIEAARAMDSSIAIIFYSAYSDELTRRRAEAVRPFAFLSKPVPDQQLSTLLHRLSGL